MIVSYQAPTMTNFHVHNDPRRGDNDQALRYIAHARAPARLGLFDTPTKSICLKASFLRIAYGESWTKAWLVARLMR